MPDELPPHPRHLSGDVPGPMFTTPSVLARRSQSTLIRLIRWVRDREWSMVVSVALAVVMELDAVLEAVKGDLDAAGDEVTWQGLLIIVGGVLIRRRVWSKASVTTINDNHRRQLLTQTSPDSYYWCKFHKAAHFLGGTDPECSLVGPFDDFLSVARWRKGQPTSYTDGPKGPNSPEPPDVVA